MNRLIIIMKQIQIFLFLVMTLTLGTVQAQPKAQATSPEQIKIMELIKNLAKLTDMADACGEHMNFFGKKALEGEVCKEFKQGFYDLWPSREALQLEVADYTYRLEQGEYKCETCDVMLQRAEELRITVTYYLDYMDFLNEF